MVLLFRSLAVVTVLFLAPILTVRMIPSLYFLSPWDAVGQLALETSALLLLEALAAAVLALILSGGLALRLWTVQADANCAGFIAFTTALSCLLVLVNPLGDSIVNASFSAALDLCGYRSAYVPRLEAYVRDS